MPKFNVQVAQPVQVYRYATTTVNADSFAQAERIAEAKPERDFSWEMGDDLEPLGKIGAIDAEEAD